MQSNVLIDQVLGEANPSSPEIATGSVNLEMKTHAASNTAIWLASERIIATQNDARQRQTITINADCLYEELEASGCCGLHTCGDQAGNTGPMGCVLLTESGESVIWLSSTKCVWTLVLHLRDVPSVVQALIDAGRAGQISCTIQTELHLLW